MRAHDLFSIHSPLTRFHLFCSPSPPPAPDLIGSAQAQGAANIKTAQTQAKLNNPNVVNPYGTQSVTWGTGFNQAGYDKALANYNAEKAKYDMAHKRWALGEEGWNKYRSAAGLAADLHNPLEWGSIIGDAFGLGGGPRGPYEGPFNLKPPKAVDRDAYIINPNQATITQKFSPEQQAIFDASNEAKLLLNRLAARGASTAGEVIGQNLDLSGLPGMPGSAEDTRDKVIGAMMGRVNEDTDRKRDELNSNLIAAGIRPGSKAYDDQMNLINRQYNDARNQAFLASGQEASRDFGLDAERRRTALGELLAQRQTPLNEIAALMSGTQVQNPFSSPGFAQNSQVQAPPLFAAQNALTGYNTDLYNAQAAQAGNMQSGLIGLGTTAAMAAAMM